VPGFVFCSEACSRTGGHAARSCDRWRRRYEDVFSVPGGCERMKLATPREKSAGFRRICPELSAFESVDCAASGRPARVLQNEKRNTKYVGIPDESREYDNLEPARRRPYYEASMVRCFCAPKLPRPDP
jgi:hypothetical protein